MTLSDLRAQLRARRLDDVPAPQRWANDELNDYLNEAEREAAIRTRCLVDSQTFTVTLADGVRLYDVDPLVIEITRVQDLDRVLAKTSVHELDQRKWWDRLGPPTHWYMDSWNQLGVYRLPTATEAGTILELTVIRKPFNDMTDDADEPEIPEHFHDGLLDWAEYLAFMKNDADTYKPDRANAALARFESGFGPRPNANILTQRARRPVQRVRGQYI